MLNAVCRRFARNHLSDRMQPILAKQASGNPQSLGDESRNVGVDAMIDKLLYYLTIYVV
jgi:hypothetical protein